MSGGPFEFNVDVRPGGPQTHVVVSGELDLVTADELRSALEGLRRSRTAVILDLSGVSFMDSSGLRLLLQAQSDAHRDGWSIEFTPR